MIPISDFMLTFWLYVQRAYAKRTGGKEIAIVSMEYCGYQSLTSSIKADIHDRQLSTLKYSLLNSLKLSTRSITF